MNATIEAIAIKYLRRTVPSYQADELLLREHWLWYLAGVGDPGSIVHHSTQAKAVEFAKLALEFVRETRKEPQG